MNLIQEISKSEVKKKVSRDQTSTLDGNLELIKNDSTTKNRKLHHCIYCYKLTDKYRCPGCHEYLCSLECYKKHMNLGKDLEEGEVIPSKDRHASFKKNPNQPLWWEPKPCRRDKLASSFKPMKELGKREILRDFDYISEIMIKSDKTRKRLFLLDSNLQKHKEMMRFKILSLNAKKRKVNLKYSPVFMTRHRENISFYFTKEKRFYWIVEFVMVRLGKGNRVEHKQILGPESEEIELREIINGFEWTSLEILNHFGFKYDPYNEASSSELTLLIKNNYIPDEVKSSEDISEDLKKQILLGRDFVEVDLKMNLKELIRCINLLEFPTLYGVKKDEVMRFKLSQGHPHKAEVKNMFRV